jgi:hypothetical protein
MPGPETRKVIEVRFSTVEQLERAYEDQISKGGYFFITDQPFPRATPVELRFHLPGLMEAYGVPAEVAFTATPDAPLPGMGPGMALQFDKLSPQIAQAFTTAITVAKAEGLETSTPVSNSAPDQDTPARETSAPAETEPRPEDADEEVDQALLDDENIAKDVMTMLAQQSGDLLYHVVRKLPLHQKIVAAKRGNRNVRAILLQEGNKKVMLFLLQNPQLGTAEVLQMLKLPNLSLEAIQQISKNPIFIQNEEIKFHVVINPKTPLPLALNLLNTLNLKHLATIAKSQMKAQLKSTALRLLEQRRK